MTSKICKECGESKPINDFTAGKAVCKECRAIKRRSDYKQTKPSISTEPKQKLESNSKIQCECGSTYALYNKSRHLKTKKHINYINKKEDKITMSRSTSKASSSMQTSDIQLYYGVGPVPIGHRQATVEEAINANQIRYYGIVAIDPNILNQVKQAKTSKAEIESQYIEAMGKYAQYNAMSQKIVKAGLKLKEQYERENDPVKKEELNQALIKKREEHKPIKEKLQYYTQLANELKQQRELK